MTHSIARKIQSEGGWTDATLLEVVLNYIENQDSDDAFTDYLMQFIEDERGMTEDEEEDDEKETPTQVEYDLSYTGGNYSKVGTFVEIHVKMNETVQQAFQREVKLNPIHIIHYTGL